MRLNRFLAAAGFGSRRSCEDLIREGVVMVNGHRIDQLATSVEPGDDVRVRGKIARAAVPTYVLLHKPKGFVVSRDDERGRRTVFDLLPPDLRSLAHAGRLDKDSEGLLLLTNDGDLTQALTHPSHGVEKEYEVQIDKPFDPAHGAKLVRGFHIEGGRAKFEHVAALAPTRLKVILKQGLKRQIRLMLYDVGYEVKRLARTRIGPIKMTGLPPGAYRFLSAAEVAALRQAVATKTPRPERPARRPRKA